MVAHSGPMFTQPLEPGEGGPRPSVVSNGDTNPGDEGPGLQSPLPHRTWGLGQQPGPAVSSGTPHSFRGLCQ